MRSPLNTNYYDMAYSLRGSNEVVNNEILDHDEEEADEKMEAEFQVVKNKRKRNKPQKSANESSDEEDTTDRDNKKVRNKEIHNGRAAVNEEVPGVSGVAVSHFRTMSGRQLLDKVKERWKNDGSRGHKKDYVRGLVASFNTYDITEADTLPVKCVRQAPWEETNLSVNIEQLPFHKQEYVTGELKNLYNLKISELVGDNVGCHVYCDGSVRDDGRSGCGVLLRNLQDGGHVDNETLLQGVRSRVFHSGRVLCYQICLSGITCG